MKNIYIFTHSYPYSQHSETFLDTEIKMASTLPNMQIVLVPFKKTKYLKKTEPNVSIINTLSEFSWFRKTGIFLSMFYHILFWKMFFKKEHRVKTFKNLFQAIKYYFGGSLICHFLKENQPQIPKNSILYSYWFSYIPLGFALYKKKTNNLSNFTFISRAHGYDLFNIERNIFIPYRRFTLFQLDAVHSVSKTGTEYLQSKYPEFHSKIETSYLGIETLALKKNLQRAHDVIFVSCSNFASVKRVSLIFKSLNQFALHHPDLKLKWIHFGNGKQFATLKKTIENTKASNLTVELSGYVTPEQLHEWYATQEADLFINLSLSEGLPVSLMEAIGYGIPILATDAGGSREICNQKTGYLLPVQFTQYQFEEGVKTILSKKEELKKSCAAFFQENFDATANYQVFYNKICQ